MEVILLERVENLGIMGDVVRVKPGYARNFLFPSEKAVPASNENKASFENKRLEIEAKNIGPTCCKLLTGKLFNLFLSFSVMETDSENGIILCSFLDFITDFNSLIEKRKAKTTPTAIAINKSSYTVINKTIINTNKSIIGNFFNIGRIR